MENTLIETSRAGYYSAGTKMKTMDWLCKENSFFPLQVRKNASQLKRMLTLFRPLKICGEPRKVRDRAAFLEWADCSVNTCVVDMKEEENYFAQTLQLESLGLLIRFSQKRQGQKLIWTLHSDAQSVKQTQMKLHAPAQSCHRASQQERLQHSIFSAKGWQTWERGL